MKRLVAILAGVALAGAWAAGSAAAQGVYVGGAVAAEVVRTSSTESGGATYDNGSGEAFGGAIRVGSFITSRFGVELEYFRPGEIETELGGPIYLAAAGSPSSVSWSSNGEGMVISGISNLTFPSIIGQTTRVRTSTTSALLTLRQRLGRRVAFVYLGGVGFSRVVRDTDFDFPRGILPLGPAIQRAYSSRTTQYAAGPVVGVEVRAGMTEHAQVVAGLRMHTLGQAVVDGWMIRPSVGLSWTF
jgi:hypothetical protein